MSLRTSNDSLERSISTKLLYEEKATKEAKLLFSKLDRIETKTIEINNYIMERMANIERDSLKVNTLVLYKRLNKYKNDIFQIDSEIYSNVKEKAQMITFFFDSLRQSSPNDFSTYLSNTSKEKKLIVMKRTLYNILLTENKILSFCDNKIK